MKERSNLYNIKVQGEATSADVEATAGYPKDLAQIINEGSHTEKQIFNVDKIALPWEKISSKTQIERRQCLASKLQSTG